MFNFVCNLRPIPIFQMTNHDKILVFEYSTFISVYSCIVSNGRITGECWTGKDLGGNTNGLIWQEGLRKNKRTSVRAAVVFLLLNRLTCNLQMDKWLKWTWSFCYTPKGTTIHTACFATRLYLLVRNAKLNDFMIWITVKLLRDFWPKHCCAWHGSENSFCVRYHIFCSCLFVHSTFSKPTNPQLVNGQSSALQCTSNYAPFQGPNCYTSAPPIPLYWPTNLSSQQQLVTCCPHIPIT